MWTLCGSSNTIVISERFQDRIIDEIQIGTDISRVKAILGKPSIIMEDAIYYKTEKYYIGFKGNSKVQYATIVLNPKAYDKDILNTTIAELNQSGLNYRNNKALVDFYETSGFVNGGGLYAESSNGIALLDFSGQKTITVYNNFEGNLYKDDSAIMKFKIAYKNSDYIVEQLELGLHDYIDTNKEFTEEGILSPNAKYKFIYRWVYSMSQYFIIKTVDNSNEDFRNPATAKQYLWLTDDYIIYIHAWEQVPYILKVREFSEHINVFKVLNISYNNSNGKMLDDYEIITVNDGIITLRNKSDNSTLKVKYYIENNKITIEKM